MTLTEYKLAAFAEYPALVHVADHIGPVGLIRKVAELSFEGMDMDSRLANETRRQMVSLREVGTTDWRRL